MRTFYQAQRFLIFGIMNFLFTNIILQTCLFFLPIWISTLSSQFVNYLLGFYLYGKFVFKNKNYSTKVALKYLLISLISWKINTISIYLISKSFGYSENLSAILVIPFLVIYSFMVQKYFVFRNNYKPNYKLKNKS